MNHSLNYRQMKVLNRKERESCVDVGGNFLCLAATTSPERSLPKLDGTLKIKARVSTQAFANALCGSNPVASRAIASLNATSSYKG